MTNLGSFGAAVRELDPGAEKDTFDFFGQEFTVVGAVPPLLTWQMASALAGTGTATSLRAACWAALYAALVEETGDDQPDDTAQFDRFYLLAVKHKASEQSLHDLVMRLFEVQAGRPTVEPQGSLPGEPETSPNSNGSLPSRPGMTPIADLVAGSRGSASGDSAT